MTRNEHEQFEAKQRAKYCRNTHCGQCGDIIHQELRPVYDFLLAMITLGRGYMQEKRYWCRCKYEFIESPQGKAVLRKFSRDCFGA